MRKLTYELLKDLAEASTIPCTILSVERLPNGKCGEIRFYAINEIFKKSYYDLFAETEGTPLPEYESFEETIEGQLYTAHLPKEPNFEDVCFRAAWKKEYIHTYVDTTRMYGYWTQDILLPVAGQSDDPSIAYCQFMYTLNKEMDTGKFATVSPDIASFVIKACLELRNENKFNDSMDIVVGDIREYTDSYAACLLTFDSDLKKFEVISYSVRNNEMNIKSIFADFPYEIVESWSGLVKETNSIIIKDENDMALVETKAPKWVKTLRDNKVVSLCLVPLIHQQEIIG